MHLIVCNLPGDAGIDWRLDDRARAAVGPGHAGVALPWRLLPHVPEHLLLALPAVGDEPSDDERAAVERALRAVGARTRIAALADDLLRHRACMIR